MPILVTNTKDHPVTLHSACGNSVQVGGKARRAPVARQFKWQVPEGVVIEDGGPDEVDPCTHVNHAPVRPLMRAPRTAEEAMDIQRQGLHPHQTRAERAAAMARARKHLDNEAANGNGIRVENTSETSVAALTAGNAGAPRGPQPRPAAEDEHQD